MSMKMNTETGVLSEVGPQGFKALATRLVKDMTDGTAPAAGMEMTPTTVTVRVEQNGHVVEGTASGNVSVTAEHQCETTQALGSKSPTVAFLGYVAEHVGVSVAERLAAALFDHQDGDGGAALTLLLDMSEESLARGQTLYDEMVKPAVTKTRSATARVHGVVIETETAEASASVASA